MLPLLDFVLLMTVEPGYAGQQMVPFAFEKIAAMKQLADTIHPKLEIEVDGNVNFENAPVMVEKGADILVGGSSSLFQKDCRFSKDMTSSIKHAYKATSSSIITS